MAKCCGRHGIAPIVDRSFATPVDHTRHLAYVPGFAAVPPKESTRFMFLFQFLLVVHAVIAASLVTVILMQRSEGGGLGMGGSPSGLMSARGAADFLTRATSILGGSFIVLSIILAVLAAAGRTTKVDATSAPVTAPTSVPFQQQAPPVGDPNAPFSSGARSALAPAPKPTASPADNGSVPLAQ